VSKGIYHHFQHTDKLESADIYIAFDESHIEEIENNNDNNGNINHDFIKN
jgi:hypothetical protein